MRGMKNHTWTDEAGKKWCAVAEANLRPAGVDFITSKSVGNEILRLAEEAAEWKGHAETLVAENRSLLNQQQDAVGRAVRAEAAITAERARLRPLLERCVEAVAWQPRDQDGRLLADLRAELGKERE